MVTTRLYNQYVEHLHGDTSFSVFLCYDQQTRNSDVYFICCSAVLFLAVFQSRIGANLPSPENPVSPNTFK